MPWVTVPQIRGKVYIPEKQPRDFAKKACTDCFACQHCSKERCSACCNREAEDDRLND